MTYWTINFQPERESFIHSHITGNPYYNYAKSQGKLYKKQSQAKIVELKGSPVVCRNYQSFRPGSFLTGGLHTKNSRYSIISQCSYDHIKHMNSLRSLV